MLEGPAPLAPQAQPLGRIAFGAFELQPLARTLLRHGQPVPIGGRAFDLLLALALAPGQVVLKDELMRRAWPLLIVEEANLRAQLRYLRQALANEAWRVKTVPGRGYLLNLQDAPGEAANPATIPPGVEGDGGQTRAPTVVISASREDAAALREAWADAEKPNPWATIQITGEGKGALGALAIQLKAASGADPGWRTLAGSSQVRPPRHESGAMAMVMVWSAPSN